MSNRKPLSRKQLSVLCLAVASGLSAAPALADTSVFLQQANGQGYSFTFPDGSDPGSHTDSGNYPLNNNWSQSQVITTDAYGDQYLSQLSNWSTPNYPNSAATDVQLGNHTVTLDVSVVVDTLTSSGALNILGGQSLEVAGAGGVTDTGTITINSNGAEAGTVVTIDNGTLSGFGTMILNGAAGLAQLNGTIIQSSTHVIQGFGEINAALTNNSVVNANVNSQILYIQTNDKTNNATFEATNGGNLDISGITVNQGAGGQITAGTGSLVTLYNASVVGGTLSTTGNGLFQAYGTDSLSNLTNDATIHLYGGQVLNVVGNLVDNGSIVVNYDQVFAGTAMTFDGGNLSGTGAITLNYSTSLAQLNGALTQASGHTINGQGEINAVLTNNGLVNANVAGQSLYIQGNNTVNSATFQATNGGNLYVNGATMTQGAAGLISAAGATNSLTFSASSISGGTITASSGANVYVEGSTLAGGAVNLTAGTMTFVNGASSIQGLTSTGIINIDGGSVVNVVGNLTDNGTITLNTDQIDAGTSLSFDGGTLSGSGTLTLNYPTSLAQLNGALTQAAGHTIQGYGEINAALTNSGVVNANFPGQILYLLSSNMTNSATFEATNGGTLAISGITVTQGSGGQISASGANAGTASLVTVTSSAITGGALNSTGSSYIGIFGADTFTSVANQGTIKIFGGQQLIIDGNLSNTGSILINPDNVYAGTELTFNGGNLSGSGSITLEYPTSLAQITGSLTQIGGHTIQGYGEINAVLDNNGQVTANVAGQTLYVQTGPDINDGTFTAIGGGNLEFNGVSVTQGGGGVINGFGNGSLLSFVNSSITAGTVSVFSNAGISVNGSTFAAGTVTVNSGSAMDFVAGTNSIQGLTSGGAVNLHGGSVVNVVGNLTDNGTITINSDLVDAGTVISFNGGTLSGTGALTLNYPASLAQLNGTLTQAVNHKIQGYGEINAALANNGQLNANVTGQALYLQSNNMANNANFAALNGGNLYINNIAITQNGAGQISAIGGAAGTASTVSVVGSSISGGSLFSSGIGYFGIYGAATFTSLTNNAIVNIYAGQALNIVGNLTNTATITVNADQNNAGTVLSFSGGILSGGGTVTLTSPGGLAQLNGTLTQSAGHTIQGQGDINAALTNNGIVNANLNGLALYLQSNNMTNSATFEATNGGDLYLNSILASQGNAGLITGAGAGSLLSVVNSTVSGGAASTTAGAGWYLYNATFTAGAVNVGSGSIMDVVAGTSSIQGLNNSGAVHVHAGSVLDIVGNLTDNGTIVVNSDMLNAGTAISFDGGIVSGNGSLTLNQPGGLALLNGALTQSAGHTIQGQGDINAALTNNGLVNANFSGQTLYLQSNDVTNNATMESTNGGTLYLNSVAVTQGTAGLINITGGPNGLLDFVNSSVTGGTVSASSGGNIQAYNATFAGGAVNLSGGIISVIAGTNSIQGLNSSGAIDIHAGSVLDVVGNATDNGSIVVNSDVLNAGTTISFNGGTLSGNGTLTLNNSNGLAVLSGSLTQSAGHTVQGQGYIYAAITNNGVINANVNGQAITLANNLTNNGTLEATNGATLNIPGYTITQGSTGVVGATAVAGTASLINLTNSAISGGTINLGTNTTLTALGANTISELTGNGNLNIASGTTQIPAGLGVSSLGSLTIAPGAVLDITKGNNLTINYGAAPDPAATLRGYLKSAYNGGVWTGAGLTSSSVEAEVAHVLSVHTGGVYGIGYVDGGVDKNQASNALFKAVGNQIVYAPALIGDANLDGGVTFIDLGIVAQNLGATNSDWEHGDFNYDGSTNFLDVGLLAQNLNKTTINTPLSELVPDPSPALTAEWNLAVAEIQANQTQPADLPEPGMLSLLAVGAGGLLARRRRR